MEAQVVLSAPPKYKLLFLPSSPLYTPPVPSPTLVLLSQTSSLPLPLKNPTVLGKRDTKMEQNFPKIAKKVWGIVRVIFYMVRKGIISKRKLIMDLNLFLKRGNKIASKAIGNLMFHNNHHDNHRNSHEYEFSCSNTPTYTLPFHLTKRGGRHHHHTNFFACAFHAPPTQDDSNDMVTMNAVKLALEMLNGNSNEMVGPMEAASPILPGFGKSPMVRQLRITDSPFPLRDVDDEEKGVVDKKAEEFIERFYKELRKQRSLNV